MGFISIKDMQLPAKMLIIYSYMNLNENSKSRTMREWPVVKI